MTGNKNALLTDAEKERYHRQIIFPDWGEEGQQKIKQATVFIAGAGGLGSPVAIYLTVAGIGCLRICDSGEPELSNLNRQILHVDEDIGRKKVHSAKMTLSKLNPHVDIVVCLHISREKTSHALLLKYLLGKEDGCIKNRLLLWEGDIGAFDEIPITKNPICLVCSKTRV